jgi:AraC-like DNA-binding protein
MTARPLLHRWPILGAPAIRLAGRFEEPGRRDLVHCLATMALHFYEYTGTLWLDERRLDLRPGDITLTPAREPARYLMRQPGHHTCIHFEALRAGREAVALPLHVRPAAWEHQAREMIQHLVQLHHASRDEPPDGPARIAAQAALQAFLLWLTVFLAEPRSLRRSAPPAAATGLRRLQRLLDERYREPWTNAQLAREAGLSPGYLARRFKLHFGVSLHRYLKHRRVDCARHLLLTTQASVKTVAYESGFANPQYFCRQFRSATGTSPARFRGA